MSYELSMYRSKQPALKIHFEAFVVMHGKIPQGGCIRCAAMSCRHDCQGWDKEMSDILDYYRGMGVKGIREGWTPKKQEKFKAFKEARYTEYQTRREEG